MVSSLVTDAVTGATSYTGRSIARLLVAHGRSVVDLTRRPERPSPFGEAVRAARLDFGDAVGLRTALAGVDTLYDTYWIRLERGDLTFERVLANTRVLLAAASEAGVRRVVQISVVHADPEAPTRYFRAKARAEEAVRASGLSWAIVRPTVTYGPADILVNNLAWVLRRLPVFGIPGDGRYPIQPVHVDEVAGIAVEAGAPSEDVVVDAAGPETLTFDAFVGAVRAAVGSRALLVHLPVGAVFPAVRLLGLAVRDIVLTADEITELRAGLMASGEPPLGKIDFRTWLAEHGDSLGRRWSSELDRHYRRVG